MHVEITHLIDGKKEFKEAQVMPLDLSYLLEEPSWSTTVQTGKFTMASASSSSPAKSETGDPWLLTPGPLTTSRSVKEAAVHDYGSRDHYFIDVNVRMRQALVEIVNGSGSHVCVPMQGSGTFVVEAMIGTLVPRDGKVLVLVNGAYGTRIAKICDVIGRSKSVLEFPENVPVDPAAVGKALAEDASITHVVAVHCETTTGILNPVEDIAAIVAEHGRRFLIDAMSAFGAIPLDATTVPFEAVVASSNKCLEGTPGLGFCVVRQDALEAAKGNAHSLTLDLHDQWTALEATKQYRFTPPVHTILSFDQALKEFQDEGGVAGRGGRYTENCRVLVDGMRRMGFSPLLPDELQAPIIVTFLMPQDKRFDFQSFYDALRDKGYVIYPGKLTVAETFRIGCIGRLGTAEIEGALRAIKGTLAEMGVADCAPIAA